ncbi:YraN family protein [Brevirhabdus sp.]|uniref:YraN family protein n=1 Tax=Brevirhabdus sp. TaxID=2004514 RepID=UPI0040581B06
MSGITSYHAGLAAEDSVARDYARRGMAMTARRWRGRSGEIDLIARDGARVIFIEVKKSSTHARAASRLSAAQTRRIYAAGSEFLAGEPRGQDTEVRFDVALVDAVGRIDVIENAIGL